MKKLCICLWVNVFISPFLPLAECDTRSIFKSYYEFTFLFFITKELSLILTHS